MTPAEVEIIYQLRMKEKSVDILSDIYDKLSNNPGGIKYPITTGMPVSAFYLQKVLEDKGWFTRLYSDKFNVWLHISNIDFEKKEKNKWWRFLHVGRKIK